MNIFRFEMKQNFRSTLIWALALAAVCFFFMAIYPSYANNAEDVRLLLHDWSDSALAAFGLDLNTFFSLEGFYSFTFVYIALCGAVQAMNLGLSIISKEYRNKTADFLLTKPVSRQQILTGKLSAVFTLLVCTNLIYIAASFLAAQLFKIEDYDRLILLLMSMSLFFIQIVFAALGVLTALLFRSIKSVISVSLSVVFGFFIIYMLDAILKEEWVRYLTPFKYFDTGYIVQHASYDLPYVIAAVIVVIAAVAASTILYVKQDVHAV